MLLWQRHLLAEWIANLCRLLAGFFLLFIIFDYASHGTSWFHSSFSLASWGWLRYYGAQLLVYSDLLLPLAALLATIKTLVRSQTSRELLALRCAGLSLQRLMTPLVAAGFGLAVLQLLSQEWLRPYAETLLLDLKAHRVQTTKKEQSPWSRVQRLPVASGGTLFYLSHDEESHSFEEVYWICSADHLFRMRRLYPEKQPPEGEWVERLERTPEGELKLVEWHREWSFPELHLDQKELKKAMVHPQQMALSELWSRSNEGKEVEGSQQEALLLTLCYQRLLLPWLSLLAVIAPMPWAVSYRRESSYGWLYSVTLFGLAALYLLLDAAAVLAMRQLVAPEWVFMVPLVLLAMVLAIAYSRMR